MQSLLHVVAQPLLVAFAEQPFDSYYAKPSRSRGRTATCSRTSAGSSSLRTNASARDMTAADRDADGAFLALAELRALPMEVLRLHLKSRSLVTSGNRAAMSKRLLTPLHMPAATNVAATTDLERTVRSLVLE